MAQATRRGLGWALVSILATGCAGHATWESYWRDHGVSPAPPPTFLDPPNLRVPRVLNLTNGALTDEVARKWVLADLRRTEGDAFAFGHNRADIVNSNVLGPPGLNAAPIRQQPDLGATVTSAVTPSVIAAAIVSVPADVQHKHQHAVLTDFVIVLVVRRAGSDELVYQLDTGDFRDNSVVGPLWFQLRGWKCKDPPRSMPDEICARVTRELSAAPAP